MQKGGLQDSQDGALTESLYDTPSLGVAGVAPTKTSKEGAEVFGASTINK